MTSLFSNQYSMFPLLAAAGVVLVLAIVAIKGWALWQAAKRDEPWWFVVMLVINTVGILELIYLIFFVKKWPWDKKE